MSHGHTCEDWCHCKACGGFKLGGVPYGHSCDCPDYLKEVDEMRERWLLTQPQPHPPESEAAKEGK